MRKAVRSAGRPGTVPVRPRAVDPVRLEIFRQLFQSVCEEMGLTLMRTGHSPNIKERRDYSCAVFDSRGRTVAQGDHMPVHLGSMPASVAAALDAFPRLGRGDVALLNDPYRGGTHLPDLTMVSPFHAGGGRAPLFYLANRAHHSDVGGMAPGSMPLATEIWQEGLILPPVLIVRAGRVDDAVLTMLRANCRTPGERTGDLRAQLAALHSGGERLRGMAARFGAGELGRAARALQDYSRRSMEAALRRVPVGRWRFADRLDDDGCGAGPIRLSVTLTVRNGRAEVDFRASADQVAGGVNAVSSITASAVAYVFRCLLVTLARTDARPARGAAAGGRGAPAAGSGEDVPWNAGGVEPIRIRLREGSVLSARAPAAVAGGNVETSQRVVDVLLGALARALPGLVPAASQGTMNNLAIGGVRAGASFAYYETIAGGAGGGPAGPGASGRHSHMTNSLNTPVEAIESSLPVRVERTTLRRGSGGAGRHRGGDGIVRELRLLCDASASLLTERRRSRPWGLRSGRPGAAGANLVIRGSGRAQPLPAKGNVALRAGDRLVILTPGGGGWGRRK